MVRDTLKVGLLLETPAFLRGRQAFENGAAATDNPFTAASSLEADWVTGWRDAQREAIANENRAFAEKASATTPADQGRIAAREGLSPRANPFHYGHPLHEDWRLGWVAGKAGR